MDAIFTTISRTQVPIDGKIAKHRPGGVDHDQGAHGSWSDGSTVPPGEQQPPTGGTLSPAETPVAAPFDQDYSDYYRTELFNQASKSRTFSGVVDTSGSEGKADAIAMTDPGEVAARAQANFKSTFDEMYANKDIQFESPQEVLTFLDGINAGLNEGIVQEGTLLRTANSAKFPYTDVAQLSAARTQFATELMERIDTDDPIEIAGWINWRVNLLDHFYEDGVGRTTDMIAGWVLARREHPMPDTDGMERSDWFAAAPTTRRNPSMGGQVYEGADYDKWQTFYQGLFGETVEKHYGPGPHASGSSQDVHGSGGGGKSGWDGVVVSRDPYPDPFSDISTSTFIAIPFGESDPVGTIKYVRDTSALGGGDYRKDITIEAIWVHKDWRRRGIATDLMAEVKKEWPGYIIKSNREFTHEGEAFWRATVGDPGKVKRSKLPTPKLIEKHYGPGPHRGTGSPQTVHSGKHRGVLPAQINVKRLEIAVRDYMSLKYPDLPAKDASMTEYSEHRREAARYQTQKDDLDQARTIPPETWRRGTVYQLSDPDSMGLLEVDRGWRPEFVGTRSELSARQTRVMKRVEATIPGITEWLNERGVSIVFTPELKQYTFAVGEFIVSPHNGPHIWIQTLGQTLSERYRYASSSRDEDSMFDTMLHEIGHAVDWDGTTKAHYIKKDAQYIDKDMRGKFKLVSYAPSLDYGWKEIGELKSWYEGSNAQIKAKYNYGGMGPPPLPGEWFAEGFEHYAKDGTTGNDSYDTFIESRLDDFDDLPLKVTKSRSVPTPSGLTDEEVEELFRLGALVKTPARVAEGRNPRSMLNLLREFAPSIEADESGVPWRITERALT